MIQLKKSIIADYYDGETVMLTQGSPFTVSCIIPGTKPEVSIDWFLDRQPLDPSFSRNTVNIIANPGNSLLKDTTGVLEIPNPGREYHGKSLRCVGTGADGIQIEGSLSLLVKGKLSYFSTFVSYHFALSNYFVFLRPLIFHSCYLTYRTQ